MFWFGAVVDETLDCLIPSFKLIFSGVRLLEATLLSVMLLVAAVITFGRWQLTVTVTSGWLLLNFSLINLRFVFVLFWNNYVETKYCGKSYFVFWETFFDFLLSLGYFARWNQIIILIMILSTSWEKTSVDVYLIFLHPLTSYIFHRIRQHMMRFQVPLTDHPVRFHYFPCFPTLTVKSIARQEPSIPKIEKCFYETSLNGVTNCWFNYHFDLFYLHHFIRSRPFLEQASSSSTQQNRVNRKGWY